MEALRRWYDGLSAREQRIVRIGAIVAAVLLLLGAVLPLERAASGAAARVERKRADLAWLRQMAPALAAAPAAPAAAANPQESLIVLVDRTAREGGLAQALTGSQPSGNGALRVQFEKAEFNLLAGWVALLARQYGIRADTATFESTDAPGVVNAAIVLRGR